MALTLFLAKSHRLFASWGLYSAAFALILLFATLSTFAENAPSAYLFKQKSAIQGNSELIVSPLGLKMTLSDRHLIIFMCPPLWHVQYFDSRSKRYFEGTKEEFSEPFARTISFSKPSSCTNLAIKASKPSTFMNLACKEFSLVDPARTAEKKTKSWEQISVSSGTFTGYDGGVSKIVGRTICQIYAMPRLDSVPLLLIVRNYRDEFSNELQTISVKKVTSTAADFMVPPHSVQVAKATDVVAEYSVDSSLTDMLK